MGSPCQCKSVFGSMLPAYDTFECKFGGFRFHTMFCVSLPPHNNLHMILFQSSEVATAGPLWNGLNDLDDFDDIFT